MAFAVQVLAGRFAATNSPKIMLGSVLHRNHAATRFPKHRQSRTRLLLRVEPDNGLHGNWPGTGEPEVRGEFFNSISGLRNREPHD